jgi:ABC-type bacteriocin/lantibiotic exporter with double-glycine peptidase domain
MKSEFIKKIYIDLLSIYKNDIILFFTLMVILEVLTIFTFSHIVSYFIKDLNNNKNYNKMTWIFFGCLLIIYIIKIFYNYIQYKIIVRLREDIKIYLSNVLLKSLNKKYINDNYLEYYSPMIKLAYKLYVIIHHLCTYYVPYFVLLIIFIGYLSYYSPMCALILGLSSLYIFISVKIKIPEIIEKSINYEKDSNDLDYELLESYGNIDKIINRNTEYLHQKKFDLAEEKTIESGRLYYDTANFFTNNMLFMLNISIFLIIIYLFNKKEHKLLILLVPLLLLYKGKAEASIDRFMDTIEVFGKLIFLGSKWDKHLINIDLSEEGGKNIKDLKFNKVKFKNIDFTYNNKKIFNKFNLELDLSSNKIIGIFGKSGTGKSTLMKLLIKNYICSGGNIYIDNVNIKELKNNELRQNILYINQNLKLFDKNVKYNLLYGCNHNDCDNFYDNLKDDRIIQNLFQNEDFQKIRAGSLGENLSGGQNQMINILNGLINKSKILILDEPTRNLDYNLKRHLKELIIKYKNNHKNIIIITHDNDYDDIFDESINL